MYDEIAVQRVGSRLAASLANIAGANLRCLADARCHHHGHRVLVGRGVNMRILVACEFSGIVRDAFAARGHDAWSCDLLPTERPGNHIQGDVMKVLNDGWDLMIAHPPCTYISNAGAKHLYKGGVLNLERLALAEPAKRLFMDLLTANIPKVAVENPVPSLVIGLPRYDQVIQPFYFGEPEQKKTCLWLKNLPLLMSTDICAAAQSTRVPGNWFNKGGKDRQKNRAKTFPGIANAMAEQWG